MPTVPEINQLLERCAELLGRNISQQLREEVKKWRKVLRVALVIRDKPGLSKVLEAQKKRVEFCLEHEDRSAEQARRIALDIQKLRAHKLLFDYAAFLPEALEQRRIETRFQASSWSHRGATWQSWLKAYQCAEEEDFKKCWQKDLRTDLKNAATELRLPFDHMMTQIQTYAGRHNPGYPNVAHFVKNNLWTRLAEKLWEDRNQIPTIISLARMGQTEEGQYLDVVGRVQGTYFLHIGKDGQAYVLKDNSLSLYAEALWQGEDRHRAGDERRSVRPVPAVRPVRPVR